MRVAAVSHLQHKAWSDLNAAAASPAAAAQRQHNLQKLPSWLPRGRQLPTWTTAPVRSSALFSPSAEATKLVDSGAAAAYANDSCLRDNLTYGLTFVPVPSFLQRPPSWLTQARQSPMSMTAPT